MTSVFQNKPFYHNSLEKFLEAFGENFSGINIRKSNANGKKVQAYKVPIELSPKNKWLSRLREQPDLSGPQIKITIPRIAFEIVDIQYSPDRKIGVNGSYAIGNNNGMRGKIYPPTPYNAIINLYTLTKDNVNDSNQILEQILPYFQPFMMLNYEILPEYGIFKDTPITYMSYQLQDAYEGSPDEIRTVMQTFTFSAQLDFFGPMMLSTAIIKDIMVNMSFERNMTPAVIIDNKVSPNNAVSTDSYTVVNTVTEIV